MDSGKEKISQEISVYLDRIEETEDGAAQAVLLIDEGEEDYSGEFHLPADFLPEDAGEGDYLTVKIFPADADNNGKIICHLKQIEKLDDGAADAVLQIVDGDKNYSGEVYIPANYLPADVGTERHLTIEIFRDEDKTNAALDEARQLLKELE